MHSFSRILHASLLLGVFIVHAPAVWATATDPAQPVLPGIIRPTESGFQRLPGHPADPDRVTRWGTPLAALTPDPRPELLRRGLAQRFPEDGSDTDAMRTAEAEAQTAQRGIWADPCCRVITPDQAGGLTQHWRVVRGTVVSITTRKNATYVNFGPDWRTDFTVVIPPRLAKTLPTDTWRGQQMEVRGWIHWQNGPALTVDVPEQIRLIPPLPPG